MNVSQDGPLVPESPGSRGTVRRLCGVIVVLFVSVGEILTPCVGVKLSHLGEDGGCCIGSCVSLGGRVLAPLGWTAMGVHGTQEDRHRR